MNTELMTTAVRQFSSSDEIRTFPHGRVELLHIGDHVVGKITLERGWRWSNDIKPIAKTEWCEAPHFQYALSGRLHVVTADKHEYEFKAGDVMWITGGHDAWVVGNEPFVAIDWTGLAEYAQQK